MNKETEVVETVEDVEKVTAEPEEHQEEPKDEKKYTDADVDKIINKKFAKWKEEAEKAEKEAEKLRKMNAEQKAEYEAQKQAERIAELEAQLNRNGLEKEASRMLFEAGITADETVLDFVVRNNAEDTQQSVQSLIGLVNTLADAKVQTMLVGKTPTKQEETGQGITKEQFRKMGYQSRNELFQTNPELYNQLKG